MMLHSPAGCGPTRSSRAVVIAAVAVVDVNTSAADEILFHVNFFVLCPGDEGLTDFRTCL